MDSDASSWTLAYCRDWDRDSKGVRTVAKRRTEEQETKDHNVDRYPKLKKVLSDLQQSDEIPDVPIDRLEVTTLANGEANARWWTARAEEPDGVHFPA